MLGNSPLLSIKNHRIRCLNSYNEEREPVAKMVLSLTDRLTRMATLQGALSQQLRNALIPILTGIHLVEDRIAETMAEIGIHYRRSSIVSGKAGHAIHAGDRAPDCEFQLVPTAGTSQIIRSVPANLFIIFCFLPMRMPISPRLRMPCASSSVGSSKALSMFLS